MTMRKVTIDDVHHIALNTVSDERGVLTIVDEESDLPFAMRRIFSVAGVGANDARGHHAHKLLNQVLVCINGMVTVTVDDGERQREFALSAKTGGLHIPPGIWSQQTYKDPGSALIVCCDRSYEEDDYIRDYEAYKLWNSRENGRP